MARAIRINRKKDILKHFKRNAVGNPITSGKSIGPAVELECHVPTLVHLGPGSDDPIKCTGKT